MLIEFDRTQCIHKADFAESLGNFMLTPLRLACGKVVQVSDDLAPIGEERIHCINRIYAAIIALLILPLSVVMTITGMIATACSRSYERASIDIQLTPEVRALFIEVLTGAPQLAPIIPEAKLYWLETREFFANLRGEHIDPAEIRLRVERHRVNNPHSRVMENDPAFRQWALNPINYPTLVRFAFSG
jgi:hypothetical protein